MKKTVLLASLLAAIALTACGKKEEAPVAAPAAAKAAVAADDVSLIGGVGPKIKEQLHAEGITSLKQIAEMSDEAIFALDEKLGLKGKTKREDWVEQAKEMVAGKAPRAKSDRERE